MKNINKITKALLGGGLVLLLAFALAGPAAAQSVVAVIPLPAEGGPTVVDPGTNRVYVVDGTVGGQIFVIDGNTNSLPLLNTIPTLFFDIDIALNPITHRIYDAQQFAGQVRVINSTNDAVVEDIPVGFIIGGVAVNPTQNRIYVRALDFGAVKVIDGSGLNPHALLATLVPGCGGGRPIAVNSTTNRVYVGGAENGSCGNVEVFDGATHALVATIPIGVPPIFVRDIVVNQNTNRIYVGSQSGISVIDGATNTVVATIPVNVFADGAMAVNPLTNRIYVANAALGLSIIDGATNTILTAIPLAPLSTNQVAVNTDTSVVYVAADNTGGPVFVIQDVPSVVPFAAFTAEVEIELGPLANDDEFEVEATFTLGADSDGIDIPTEIVSLELTGGTGAFSATIPAGSFELDDDGIFEFEGVINGVTLDMEIVPLGGGNFEFQADGEGANLDGTVNPVTVGLTIGNDGGSTTVTAEFE